LILLREEYRREVEKKEKEKKKKYTCKNIIPKKITYGNKYSMKNEEKEIHLKINREEDE
jgi:hypothetical protein